MTDKEQVVSIVGIDSLADHFLNAANQGSADEEFHRLLGGYKALFGDQYEALVHILYHHHGAAFYNYLDQHLKLKNGS